MRTSRCFSSLLIAVAALLVMATNSFHSIFRAHPRSRQEVSMSSDGQRASGPARTGPTEDERLLTTPVAVRVIPVKSVSK